MADTNSKDVSDQDVCKILKLEVAQNIMEIEELEDSLSYRSKEHQSVLEKLVLERGATACGLIQTAVGLAKNAPKSAYTVERGAQTVLTTIQHALKEAYEEVSGLLEAEKHRNDTLFNWYSNETQTARPEAATLTTEERRKRCCDAANTLESLVFKSLHNLKMIPKDIWKEAAYHEIFLKIEDIQDLTEEDIKKLDPLDLFVPGVPDEIKESWANRIDEIKLAFEHLQEVSYPNDVYHCLNCE